MEKALPEQMNGGENDFESLMEESLKAPRSGDVLVGRVLLITRDSVIIDINYKCEGQVPLEEFLDHEGHPTVKEGEEVDVYFEGTETENGTVMLSHAKAEKFKVWRELDKAFQRQHFEGSVLREQGARRRSRLQGPADRSGVALCDVRGQGRAGANYREGRHHRCGVRRTRPGPEEAATARLASRA